MIELKYRPQWSGNRKINILVETPTHPTSDEKNDMRIFSRTVCGFAWPSRMPGALVVVAETIAEMPFNPTLRILHVFESPDVDELFDQLMQAKGMLKFDAVLGDTFNQSMMQLFYRWNRLMDERRSKGLLLSKANFLKQDRIIDFHIRTVKSLLNAKSKRLFIGKEHQKIAAALSALRTADLYQLQVDDHPLLAALGFVAAYMKSYPFLSNDFIESKPKKWDMWGPLKD